MTVRALPAVLLAVGFMPPLLAEDGTPYDSNAMPCSQRPADWDEDAPLAVRTQAAYQCLGCPARWACNTRRLELGELAQGVMAGHVIPAGVRDERAMLARGIHYDATVSYYLQQIAKPPQPQEAVTSDQ
jgi:hypothetical protein